MNLLVEKAREFARTGVFTYSDALIWLGGTRNSVRCKIMRAAQTGDILLIRRGLYCLSRRHNPAGVSRNLLANLIYGPSYAAREDVRRFVYADDRSSLDLWTRDFFTSLVDRLEF